MSSFNRDVFKAAKVEVNKAVTQEVNQTLRTQTNRGDYHTIDEGVNIFRLFPPHPSKTDQPTFQPKVVYWLEVKVPKYDTNNNIIEGEFEWKKRPIFDSRVHGGTPKDIVDEYIKFTKQQVYNDTTLTKEAQQKKLAPISGYRDRSGKWTPGIYPNTSYVAYATKGTNITKEALGRLELWEIDKTALENMNIDDESGQPIQTDIFSDPNDGVQFIYTKRKDDKGKWETIIQRRVVKILPGTKVEEIGRIYEEFAKSQIISDEVLEHFLTMESLEKQFKNVYKRSDFIKAFQSLERFDKANNFNSFVSDEFLDIVEEINKYYPETEDDTEKPLFTTESNDLDSMTRDELKKYISDNNLPIKVLKSMSEQVIIEMIREVELESQEEDEDDIPFAPKAEESGCLGKDEDDDEPKKDTFVEELSQLEGSVSSTDQPRPLSTLRDRLAAAKANKQ